MSAHKTPLPPDPTVRWVTLWFEGWYHGRGGVLPSYDRRWFAVISACQHALAEEGIQIFGQTVQHIFETYMAAEINKGRRWRLL